MRLKRKARVLIVDDSAAFRQLMTRILETDPDIEVLGAACDPYVAVQRIRENVPDVITLDIEMPRMDGLTFLEQLMSQHPIPTVICSSQAEAGSGKALLALERGAVEIVTKPKLATREFFEESRIRICDAVKAAACARIGKPGSDRAALVHLKNEPLLERPPSTVGAHTADKVVVVGASTGGTEALRELLQGMPPNCPGIAIVQHMPERFTSRFASRLNSVCRINVKEAADGDPVVRGQALIAPGNRHMVVIRNGGRLVVELNDGPLVSRHRPSVDMLFRSAARQCGKAAIGVILTGMGDDGALGMLELKQAGAFNLAQDEESCVVFGMPKEAIRRGGVDRVLSLNKISSEVLKLAK